MPSLKTSDSAFSTRCMGVIDFFLQSCAMWLTHALLPMLVNLGSNLVLVFFLTDEDRFEFVLHFVTSGD
jgi:hypothetical protein